MKLDIRIVETVFGIVLKFHDQTPPVGEVITIPVTILKQHAACCFIGLTMNYIIVRSSDKKVCYRPFLNYNWNGNNFHHRRSLVMKL